jgi:hypothetical protein
MELREPAPVRQSSSDERDLPREEVEVRLRLGAVSGDDDVAAAEQTPLLAERKVDVERERGFPEGVGLAEVFLVELRLEILEFDGGGITRIARTGPIVLLDEAPNRLPVRGNPTRHDATP